MVYGLKNNTVASYNNFQLRKAKYAGAFVVILLHTSSIQAMEPFVTSLIGSTVSNTVSNTFSSARDWLQESPKTFDNEFNEATCGIERDRLRRITEKSFEEIKKNAGSYQKELGTDIPVNFNDSIFVELGQISLRHFQKYELAIITLDYIEQTKKLLDDTLLRLNSSLIQSHSARIYGESKAKQLDSSRQETVMKAVKVVSTWKMNLLAALHHKYSYVCEGGVKDRFQRSSYRHRERGKYWQIEPDWWGYVSIPKLDLGIENPFKDEDANGTAGALVNACHDAYQFTIDLLFTHLEKQIGEDKLGYASELKQQFYEMFEKTPTEAFIDKPEILTQYIKFIHSQYEESLNIADQ